MMMVENPSRAEGPARIEELLELGGQAYMLAARLLGPGADAEDAVQQAYLVAVGRLRSGATPDDLKAWFLTAVINTARKGLRSAARRKKREDSMAVMNIKKAGAPSEPDRDLIAALDVSLAALDEKYRLPISLCYEHGMSQQEAARVLEMPQQTLSYHVREGLDLLRQTLSRAGYAAAPAAVIGALAHTAPPVPATLAAALGKLVLNGVGAGLRPAPTTGTAASAAAKGGIIVKIGLGVVAAGLVAGGVFWAVGGPSSPSEVAEGLRRMGKSQESAKSTPVAPVAEKVPGKDFPYGEGTVYKREGLFGGGSGSGYEDGAATEIESGAGTENAFALAPSGNWYIVDSCVTRTVRKYDAKKKRVSTIAWAGPWGKQGGRAAAIRLGDGGYLWSVGVSVDPAETFLRLYDPHNNKTIWRLDLKTGLAETLPGNDAAKGAALVVDAPDGSTYIAMGDGTLKQRSPDGQVKVLGVKLETPVISQAAFVDGKQERIISMMRERGQPWGVVWYWDLKTGKGHPVAGPKPGEKVDMKLNMSSGPADKVSFWCPGGFSLGPDKGERYVYLGGGDESNFSIIDMQKNYVYKLVHADPKDGSLWTFGEGKDVRIGIDYPGAPIWGQDGEFYMTVLGKGVEVFRPVEVKK